MIKARAGDTVIFGLSEMNIVLLKQGMPIAFDGGIVGLDGNRILIMYGETEQLIIRALEEALDGDAKDN